jgi:hypothetical protein
MRKETPAARGDRGVDLLPGASTPSIALAAYRAKHLASRFSLPMETAAIYAAIAFGSAHHG